jgi:ABC-type Na+ efflux pump permease subunit
MDLLAKVIIIAILLIAIVFIIFSFFAKSTTPQTFTRAEAINIVEEDILNRTPNAQIRLISANSSANGNSINSSWNIDVVVVYNGTKACPTLLEEYYNYPVFGLSSTNTIYTENCKGVYANAPNYVISMPQIAIVESYNENALADSYVSTFGYENTNVYAKKINLTSNDIYSLGIPANSIPSNFINGNSILNNIWFINYTAINANYNLYLLMNQSGNIITSFFANKTK